MSAGEMTRSLSVTTAGNAVNESLVLAREEAIAHHSITAAAFDWKEKKYAVLRFLRDENTGELRNEWEEMIHWRKLPKSILFDTSSPSPRKGIAALLPEKASDFVMFNIDGTIYNSAKPKTITVFDAKNVVNYYRTVVLPATGLLKVERMDP